MFFLGTQTINSQGHLEIGGCDSLELAQNYATPLIVMDEAHIRHQMRSTKGAFEAQQEVDPQGTQFNALKEIPRLQEKLEAQRKAQAEFVARMVAQSAAEAAKPQTANETPAHSQKPKPNN